MCFYVIIIMFESSVKQSELSSTAIKVCYQIHIFTSPVGYRLKNMNSVHSIFTQSVVVNIYIYHQPYLKEILIK